jgi:hypothetical protein
MEYYKPTTCNVSHVVDGEKFECGDIIFDGESVFVTSDGKVWLEDHNEAARRRAMVHHYGISAGPQRCNGFNK